MSPKSRVYHRIVLAGVKFDVEALMVFSELFKDVELQKDVVHFIGTIPVRAKRLPGFDTARHVVTKADLPYEYKSRMDPIPGTDLYDVADVARVFQKLTGIKEER